MTGVGAEAADGGCVRKDPQNKNFIRTFALRSLARQHADSIGYS